MHPSMGGRGGGGYKLGLLTGYHRIIKKSNQSCGVLFNQLGAFYCFVCTSFRFTQQAVMGGSDCSDNWLNSPRENKGEITETYHPVKSFTNIYRNLLQEYVHFFGGCNSFANKTGWVHKQEICTVNIIPVLSLLFFLQIAR